MASRNPDDLCPEAREKYFLFEAKMQEAGLDFKLTCTARSYEEQFALYQQGRLDLVHVNELRKEAGLPPITEEENKRKVTWTLSSKHIVWNIGEGARAFDIVLLKDGRAHWDLKVDVQGDSIPDYEQAAEIGESVGLIAGARFGDYPHFEV